MRQPGRRAGAERRAHVGAGRRLARVGVRHVDRPPVRLVDAGCVQRVVRDPGGAPRRRRCLGRRVDVARADGIESHGQRLRGVLAQALRALGGRAAGHLRRGHRRRVGALTRGSRRVLVRVPPARDRRDRRGSLRARDRPRRDRCGRRSRPRRGRREPEARHVAREAGVAQARVQGGRQGHRGQLERDRRRRRRDARHERGRGRSARAGAAWAVRVVRDRRRRPVPHAPRQPARVRARARAGRASRGTTSP